MVKDEAVSAPLGFLICYWT